MNLDDEESPDTALSYAKDSSPRFNRGFQNSVVRSFRVVRHEAKASLVPTSPDKSRGNRNIRPAYPSYLKRGKGSYEATLQGCAARG